MPETALANNLESTKPTHPSAERIGLLREKIKNKIPDAERIVRKSGLSPRENLRRMVINTAGEKVRDAIQAEIQVKKESSMDELTGLLNLKGLTEAFDEKIAASSRSNSDLTIIYLDANNLKRINDTQGHAAGDEYLISIAQTLKACTRVNDAVSRWGGDEYAVILENANIEAAKEWWEQIKPLFKEKGISVGAGASTIQPEDLQDPPQYARVIAQAKDQADKALYVAKPISKSTNDCIMISSTDLRHDIEIEQQMAA